MASAILDQRDKSLPTKEKAEARARIELDKGDLLDQVLGFIAEYDTQRKPKQPHSGLNLVRNVEKLLDRLLRRRNNGEDFEVPADLHAKILTTVYIEPVMNLSAKLGGRLRSLDLLGLYHLLELA